MLSRLVASRSYATAANAATRSSPSSSTSAAHNEQKVSRLSNGISVCSIDNHGPVSQYVIAYRAGTRYEQADEAGLVHHIRHVIGIDSNNYLGVKLLWQNGSIGGTLCATSDQDLLLVHISALRNHSPIALSLLGEFAQPAMKPWDIQDLSKSMQIAAKAVDPYEMTMDKLHKAAYRNGPLGNSTISPVFRAGHMCPKKMAKYCQSRLVAGETALVGINVDHNLLAQYASEQNSIPEGKGPSPPASPYYGGDTREASGSKLAHVAIAGAGVGLGNVKEVAAQHVLAAAIGHGPATKYSPHHGHGVVTSNILKSANHNPVGIAPVNVTHSDSGLVGVYIVADGSRIEPYVRAAVDGMKQLGSQGASGDALEIAKKQAELNILIRGENPCAFATDMAAQVLASDSAKTPVQLAQEVHNVSNEDVKKAAQKLMSKLSIGAYGNISHVPYADQL